MTVRAGLSGAAVLAALLLAGCNKGAPEAEPEATEVPKELTAAAPAPTNAAASRAGR